MYQVLVRLFMGAFLQIAGSLVGRVLLALGFSYVTYSGFNVGIDWIKNQIISNMSAMPSDVLSFLSFLWVDKAIGVMFSAYSSAVAIKVGVNGTITKMMVKK